MRVQAVDTKRPLRLADVASACSRGALQACGLGCLAFILALAANVARPKGLPLLPVQQMTHPQHKEAAVPPLTIAEAFGLFQEDRAFFLDARAPEVFREGHIPGALNVMPGTSANVAGPLKAARNRVIVVYCEETGCDLAELLASELSRAGYPDIRIMPDGWLGWEGYGYPVEAKL